MRRVKLGQICEVVSGGTPKTNVEEYWNGEFNWITPAEINDNDYIISDTKRKITQLAIEKKKLTLLPKGTILLSSRAPIGKVAIAGKEMYCNQGFKNLICSDEICNEYLYWYLKSKKEYLNSLGRGATFKEISKKIVENIEIKLPEIEQQRKIVNKLKEVDKIIQQRKCQSRLLDGMVQARFVELFGDAVYNDKKWETDTVKNLCKEIYGGGTPSKAHPEYYKDGDIPWVSAKDMKTDVLKDSQIKINQLGVDNSTARLVPVNSVIMVIRSGILKHTLPIAVNKVPITVNQDLKVFIPGERILTRFLAVQFKMQEKDILSGVRAVTADNIEFNSLKQRRMIVPPIDLQQKYLMFLERIDKSKFVIHKFLYCFIDNKQSIIKPRLNTKESGKIRGGKPHADEF